MYIYIYIYVYVYMYICIYIYIWQRPNNSFVNSGLQAKKGLMLYSLIIGRPGGPPNLPANPAPGAPAFNFSEHHPQMILK